MLKKDKTLLLLLPALWVAFGLGVGRLFQLRFQSGDVYPPYSSLRADPLGTKAFFESLENLRGLTVRRFIQPLEKLPEGRDRTLFVFGADTTEMNRSTEDEYKKLEQFMFDGGRIVVSFPAVNTKPWAVRREEAKGKKNARESSGKDRVNSDKQNEDESGPKKKHPPDDEEERLLDEAIPTWTSPAVRQKIAAVLAK